MPTLTSRLTKTGTLLVNGTFDEYTGAPVVNSSLKLWLDAGQLSSYPGTGTTWTDLSGSGNNGTITNGPLWEGLTNGGAFTFNGSTQYTTTTLDSGTIRDGTLSAWCYPIASPNAAYYDGIIDGDLPGSYGTGIGINNGTYQAILNNQFWTTIGQAVTLNQWVMVSMTFTATTAIFYLNGAQAATLTYTRGAVSPGTNYLVGKSAANARYFNGRISTAMVYNRALTANEIAQNYNSLAARYGLSPTTLLQMPVTQRLTTSGNLLVNNGGFDELSLGTGAISFNGTTQYLSATSPDLSGTWTVEMWCYWTTGATQTTIVSFNNGSNSGINLWKNSSNQLVADDGVNGVTAMSAVTPTINAWNHIAFVRSGTTTSGYVNGVLAGTTTYTPGTTSIVNVGRYNGGSFFYFPGYISNLRVVNGTAVYTANFTPPQAILPSIPGTSLLLNATDSANFIKDNSPNNYTVTNNGTATWTAVGPFNRGTTVAQRQVNDGTLEVYTAIDEFTGAPVVDSSVMVWLDSSQSASFANVGSTWYDLTVNSKNYTLSNIPTYTYNNNGPVLTFAGASSQFTTSATTLFNSTTFNAYTINLWVYPTGAGQLVAVDGQATINTGYHYSAIEISAAGVIKFGQWTGGMTTIATSTQSLNAWYNLVITYNGSTATAYVNNTNVGSSAIAWSSPGASTFFPLMGIDTTNMGTTGYASGSVGAFMVYNRGLSADEVSNNFNALRRRYGI